MDAVKRLNENFLSCSICTERFTDPSTLGCGHTFCRACLVRYTKTRPDAITAKSILCANCRQMTKVPNPSKPVEEWPIQLKPSFLIQGLLDEFQSSEDSTLVADEAVAIAKLCFPCQQMGKTIPAGCFCEDCDIPLCGDCMKMHQTLPVTSNHALSDIKEGVKVKRKRKLICKEHNSDVEFCCRKCNKAVCPKCGIIYHGKCDSIVSIDSMVAEMKSTLKETKSNIITSISELQTNLALQKSKIETIEQNKVSKQQEIKKVREEVIELVTQKEKKLMVELDELTEKQTRPLRGQIKFGETDLEMYQQYSESLDQALSSESPNDQYDMYRIFQSGAIQRTVEHSVSDTLELGTVKLVDKQDLHEFGKKFHLGRLTLDLVKADVDLTKTPRLHQTIKIRIEGDETMPLPRDMTVIDVMGEEMVVVTNYENHCIRYFHAKGTPTCNKTLSLKHKPNTVSKLTSNRLVVSSPFRNEFNVIQIPELLVLSTIPTQKDYICLAVLNQKELVACCCETASIDVIDLSGKVLRSLINDRTLQKLTQKPCYICVTNQGRILVSDDGSKSVFCLTQKGEIVFSYRPEGQRVLIVPRGITATSSGDILFVDSETAKVIQLTAGGEFVREFVLTSQNGLFVKGICGICLHGNILYIGEYYEGTMKEYHF